MSSMYSTAVSSIVFVLVLGGVSFACRAAYRQMRKWGMKTPAEREQANARMYAKDRAEYQQMLRDEAKKR